MGEEKRPFLPTPNNLPQQINCDSKMNLASQQTVEVAQHELISSLSLER